MQEEYIEARMRELAGVYRPGGSTPTEDQLREFTIRMMREDSQDADIPAEEFDAALKAGNVESLHRKAREISVGVLEASAIKRDKVRRLQLVGLALLVTCFMLFLYFSF